MRICPWNECGTPIEGSVFLCDKHIKRLSAQQKARVDAAFADYRARLIPLDVVRKIQDEVLTQAQKPQTFAVRKAIKRK
jgi:hypothetical protein